MRRFELVGLAALLVLGLYLLVGGLLAGGGSSARAAGDTVSLLFMSAQGRTSASPIDFCTGTGNPPIHGSDRAIDVTGDNAGSLCAFNESSDARLRGWGWGSQAYHHTMGAWATGGVVQGGCDVVLIGLIDVGGGWHGQLRYLHMDRDVAEDYQLKYYSAPTPYGAQYGRHVGDTTDDTDCSTQTEAWNVHQGTLIGCMGVNSGLGVSDESPVWDFWSYINVITYTEGMDNCDT